MDEKKTFKDLGIEAFIALQGLTGNVETPETAEKAWDGMADFEKAATVETYELFKREGHFDKPSKMESITREAAQTLQDKYKVPR